MGASLGKASPSHSLFARVPPIRRDEAADYDQRTGAVNVPFRNILSKNTMWLEFA